MSRPTYDDAPVPIRAESPAAHQDTWRRIARPGTWLDGKMRVAIAAETRNAPGCALCAERKAALSPFAVQGIHDGLGALPEAMIEVIHRIVTDPARLRRQWYADQLAGGLAETEYVEIVGVVCSTVSVDTFAKAIGAARPDLPEPEPGAPSRHRPDGIKPGDAWVPWLAPEDAGPAEADLYEFGAANIRRALSSVPDEQRNFFGLVSAQYLPGAEMRNAGTTVRSISRSQIELVAGRVSALNQCVY